MMKEYNAISMINVFCDRESIIVATESLLTFNLFEHVDCIDTDWESSCIMLTTNSLESLLSYINQTMFIFMCANKGFYGVIQVK